MKRNWKKCQNSKNSETSASRLNCREARMLTKWRQVLVENSRFPVHYLLVKTFLSLETDCTRFLLTYLLTCGFCVCVFMKLCCHRATSACIRCPMTQLLQFLRESYRRYRRADPLNALFESTLSEHLTCSRVILAAR